MFFGGDCTDSTTRCSPRPGCWRIKRAKAGPLSRLLADLPKTYATPELRVDCPDEQKFDLVQEAAQEFRRQVPRVDARRRCASLSRTGGGLLRASNTQPVLVMRFEATSAKARDAYRAEVEGWLAARGVTA